MVVMGRNDIAKNLGLAKFLTDRTEPTFNSTAELISARGTCCPVRLGGFAHVTQQKIGDALVQKKSWFPAAERLSLPMLSLLPIRSLTTKRLLCASSVVAITIALKTLAWFVTDSVKLLSDAMESFVNRASAIFALMMVTVAQRPADEEHAYGHHQVKHFSSGLEGTPIVDGTGVYRSG